MTFARSPAKAEQIWRQVRVDRKLESLFSGHLVLWSSEESARVRRSVSPEVVTKRRAESAHIVENVSCQMRRLRCLGRSR